MTWAFSYLLTAVTVFCPPVSLKVCLVYYALSILGEKFIESLKTWRIDSINKAPWNMF